MAGFRPLRVGVLIKKELSELIVRELDFGGALVTITSVDVAKKLDHASVLFSVYPSKKFSEVKKILNSQTGRLQHLLLKKVNIKPMPRILFIEDHGVEKAAQVEKALLEE